MLREASHRWCLAAIATALSSLLVACDGDRATARVPSETPPASSARDLEVEWIGEPSDDGPVIVLLHGFGAPGDDLVPLARALRERLDAPPRFVLPAGPIALSPASNARAWWPIDDFGRDRPADRGGQAPEGLAEARRDVIALLERLQVEGHLDPDRTVIGGFSQGAMLAADVALEWDAPLAGLVMLSGGPVDEARWRRRMSALDTPVFISHGRGDPLLSFAAAERLRAAFADSGSDVTFAAFDGGHTIPASVVARLTSFLNERATLSYRARRR